MATVLALNVPLCGNIYSKRINYFRLKKTPVFPLIFDLLEENFATKAFITPQDLDKIFNNSFLEETQNIFMFCFLENCFFSYKFRNLFCSILYYKMNHSIVMNNASLYETYLITWCII